MAEFNGAELGRRVKQLRLQKGYTLKEIEAKVGVSATHISEVERGKTSPTVGALSKIAKALDVNASFLIDLPVGQKVAVTTRQMRKELVSDDGVMKVDILSTGASATEISSFVITLVGDQKDRIQRESRPGEKLVFVLDGILEVVVSEKKFLLKKGDSLHFKATQPHSFLNLSETPCRFYMGTWPRFTL
jgi:transcriptional regulator with XRE-family HTH domain